LFEELDVIIKVLFDQLMTMTGKRQGAVFVAAACAPYIGRL